MPNKQPAQCSFPLSKYVSLATGLASVDAEQANLHSALHLHINKRIMPREKMFMLNLLKQCQDGVSLATRMASVDAKHGKNDHRILFAFDHDRRILFCILWSFLHDHKLLFYAIFCDRSCRILCQILPYSLTVLAVYHVDLLKGSGCWTHGWRGGKLILRSKGCKYVPRPMLSTAMALVGQQLMQQRPRHGVRFEMPLHHGFCYQP
jgi:hypothetical protein